MRILISFPRHERTVVYQPPALSSESAATAATAARDSDLPDELVSELNKDSLDVLAETIKVGCSCVCVVFADVAIKAVAMATSVATAQSLARSRQSTAMVRSFSVCVSLSVSLRIDSVRWWEPVDVAEAHALIKAWKPLSSTEALELFDARYVLSVCA